MVIKHVVFFTVNKSRRYLTELCLFGLAYLGCICLGQIMKKKISIHDQSETLTFFSFLHSDNYDLFSLTFLQTSNIQWVFLVPLHQRFSTHGTVFEVNWSPPCWNKMRENGGRRPWCPPQKCASLHCRTSHILITLQRAQHAGEAWRTIWYKIGEHW